MSEERKKGLNWDNFEPLNNYYRRLSNRNSSIDISKEILVDEYVENAIKKIKTDDSILLNIKKYQDEIASILKSYQEKETDKTAEITSLQEANRRLQNELDLMSLRSQINEQAQDKIQTDSAFKDLFFNTKQCNSFVLSIDIRRSTELMLKAREPDLFEFFITELCNNLSKIITTNFGIFDKFTGDGILAFFPDFYSGPDAGLFAAKAAFECHSFFKSFYKENRHCFNSIITDIGLGIGIDYGKTHLATLNSFTVIGAPVVYACRMATAPASQTYLNQPAYELLSTNYDSLFSFTETIINLKHEGNTIAYIAKPKKTNLVLSPPNWDKLVIEFSNNQKERQTHESRES